MDRPGFADQKTLRTWADAVESRTEFPRLIRHLILETTPGIVALGMPAGEGVSGSGWDGSVRSTGSTAWVPQGLSLWELPVEKAVGAKAESDYDKRQTTPDGSLVRDATYVAGSLRRWAKRGELRATTRRRASGARSRHTVLTTSNRGSSQLLLPGRGSQSDSGSVPTGCDRPRPGGMRGHPRQSRDCGRVGTGRAYS